LNLSTKVKAALMNASKTEEIKKPKGKIKRAMAASLIVGMGLG